ncbi:MFS drug transporter [Apiospora marii]|uniref:MFS drug transporter n=1 Tax=Apiospora marii TaxID=335849 RepID=UPI003131331F
MARPHVLQPPAGDRPELLESAFHEFAFVTLIAMAAASSVFLQRSIMVIAANIAEALSMSPTEMAWSTAASTLATGALLIPFGHLADIDVVPRKTFLLFSLAAFALLVALASLAPDGVVLNVLTGLAGVACAATIPAAVGILSLVYPRASRRKNIVFSSFLMGNPAATVIGGLVSGELASDYDWKPPFVFLAALYAFITVLGSIFVPNVAPGNSPDSMTTTPTGWSYASYPLMPGTKTRPTTLWLCLDKFDWLGTFLLLAGTLLCTVASTIGPGQSWETPTVICLLFLGSTFLGCFVV